MVVPSSFQQKVYPATNNIFINPTLFKIYGDYFQTTILPLLGITNRAVNLRPLSSTNRLDPLYVSFKMGYLCTVTEMKPWPSFLLALVIGDYTILRGLYGLMMMAVA